MIDLVVFDVDGTLTNGNVIYDTNGNESKSFNIKDGLAISTWNKIPNKSSAFITGRVSTIVEKRAKELGVKYIYQGIINKQDILDEIAKKENLKYENIAIMGDDLNDYQILNTKCLSFCPKNASFYIQDIVDIILESKGGKGAGREMIEYILKRDPKALKQYLSFYIDNQE
jgi:3-deoxy-D-manno-octulosonate 8-phosphate phosphatase (KDO 8-P phosphatase)